MKTRRRPPTRLRAFPRWARAALVAALAAAWLARLVATTEIVFPDGLRYIEQARSLDRGAWSDGLRRAVDHPLYPLLVAAFHRAFRLDDAPRGWEVAAQGTAAAAGFLLLLPLYLSGRELFGRSAARLGCLLTFLVPLPPHVLADALSEGTFLVLWSWGVYFALRFLRGARLCWLAPVLACGGLAYLTRPEGLLLPLALLATLGLTQLVPQARLDPRLWRGAVAIVLAGPVLIAGPYVVAKGGLGTKPAVARLLGLAPPSRPDAVEREHPLDPTLSPAMTGLMALRAAGAAVVGVVTAPLLPFALFGLFAAARRTGKHRLRAWLLLGLVLGASFLTLMRLHATGGYCTPRHALLLALPLLAAAGAGIRAAVAVLFRSRRGAIPGGLRLPRVAPLVLTIGMTAANAPALVAPVNAGAGAYREAGLWVAANVPPGGKVIDVTGWSQFYGERPGYDFANLESAATDPAARWVVVRDAHLWGPWPYCKRLRALISGTELVARFPAERQPGRSRVSVYERPTAAASGVTDSSRSERIRR